MKQTYYKTCPICGANLDPGEHCDCMGQVEQERGNDHAYWKGHAHGEADRASAGSAAQVSARMERQERRQAAGIYGALLGA